MDRRFGFRRVACCCCSIEARFGGAVSRILSARDRSQGENHLSFAAHPKLCVLSDRGTGRPWSFLFGLAPDGACRASAIALGAVGSYPTFSPLPQLLEAVCFLWRYPSMRFEAHLPRVSPAEPELRGVLPYGVRTFLSQPKLKAILRPTEARRTIH